MMLLPQAHLHVHGAAPPADPDFIFEVVTTATDEEFTLAVPTGGGYDAVVDWGDGSPTVPVTSGNQSIPHIYATPGTYELRISGTWPKMSLHMSTRDLIGRFLNYGDVGITDASNLFRQCTNMRVRTADKIRLLGINAFYGTNDDSDGSHFAIDTNTTRMSGCFRYCSFIVFNNARAWDLSAVTWNNDFRYLFHNGYALRLDPYDWVANPVGSMQESFNNCGLLDGDFSNWNFSGVNNFSNVFNNCSSMSQANVDNFLAALYRERNNFAWATPSVDISDCATPSGIYQDPGGAPTSGLETVYVLENDPQAEGFNTWSITF